MAAKKSYNRYFIIFQEDDKGFGIAIDKQPTGYTKIETRNDKCKITVYAQNLKKERGPYICCLIDATKNPILMARLGEIKIDEMGRGETWWEFKEDDIAGTGVSVDRFNVAAIIVDGEPPMCPTVGYIGKEKILWKDRLAPKTRTIQEDETYVTEELDEDAKKFKTYEEEIIKEAQRDEVQQAPQEVKAEEDNGVKKDEDNDLSPKALEAEAKENSEREEAPKAEDAREDNPASDAVPREDVKSVPGLLNNDLPEQISGIPGGIEESVNPEMFRDDNSERGKYSQMFNDVLVDFKEFDGVPEDMQGTRWWIIPYNDDIPVRENKYYPYYCAVYHLKMTYPYINYIRYFKNPGHYYFGIKYDNFNEVKYIMYGIEGRNIMSDQPYMGMTGFVKWVPFKDGERGMWVMYYNPYTGSIMIPKQKRE